MVWNIKCWRSSPWDLCECLFMSWELSHVNLTIILGGGASMVPILQIKNLWSLGCWVTCLRSLSGGVKSYTHVCLVPEPWPELSPFAATKSLLTHGDMGLGAPLECRGSNPSYVLESSGMLLKYTDAQAPPEPNEIRISEGRTQASVFFKLPG